MRDHGLIEELISAEALGGLEPADEAELARQRAAHGEDCVECRSLAAQYAEVAGRLAFALDPAGVPEGLEDQLLGRALRRAPTNAIRARKKWRGIVAVAASLVLFAGGFVARSLTAGGWPSPAEFIRGARLVRFQGTGGELTLAYRPGERGVYLFGSGFQIPPPGRVFELWRVRGASAIRTACFSPRGEGGTLLAFADVSLERTSSVAVTVESSACPTRPTTEPILTANLGSA